MPVTFGTRSIVSGPGILWQRSAESSTQSTVDSRCAEFSQEKTCPKFVHDVAQGMVNPKSCTRNTGNRAAFCYNLMPVHAQVVITSSKALSSALFSYKCCCTKVRGQKFGKVLIGSLSQK